MRVPCGACAPVLSQMRGEDEMNFERIGMNLDMIRRGNDLSVAKLASAAGVSYHTAINHIRTGKINDDMLCRYAEVLGCTVSDLTEG